MSEVIDIFKNKQKTIAEEIAKTEPLQDWEVEAFKDVMLQSVASFCELSVYEKLSLYTNTVHLVFTLMDLIDGKLTGNKEGKSD
ncbi:hypothetical protein D3C85_1098200 [compost metagenome]